MRVLALAAAISLSGQLLPAGSAVAEDAYLTVEFHAGMNIRHLAEEHLGDSDLWPEILKASGIASITDLRPGQSLKIPVAVISNAKQALDESLVEIQKANEAGAQLFAPKQITTAITYRDEALVKQTAGAWAETLDLATLSQDEAASALKVCVANRDLAAEARLSDRQGAVEGQRPRDLAWSGRNLNAILIEEERVRTLSRSTAQITFRDASRLRLNANSQAVIQRMRHDPLSRRQEAKVSLVEGDFYALLASDNNRKQFKVELPNVDAQIDSGNFWVQHDGTSAKFANYDDRKVNISSKGTNLELGRNEGATVREGEAPSDKFDVLSAPALLTPGENEIVYKAKFPLQWRAVDQADGYWLEIASDPTFDRMVHSRWGLLEPVFEEDEFAPGVYYWRVAALDSTGVPGARTGASRFEVRIDTVPPYLRINGPDPEVIIRKATVTVTGESEPDAAVTVNGERADVDAQGRYSLAITPRPGDNRVLVVATDPAGNATDHSRSFTYMPDQDANIVFAAEIPRQSEHHFLTNTKVLSLSGTAVKDANILVQTAADELRSTSYADAEGHFAFNVPLEAETEYLKILVIAPSGFTTESAFDVTVDQTPPVIALVEPLPRLTSSQSLTIKGTVDAGSLVILNQKDIKLVDGKFEKALNLRAGLNLVEIVATDPVGNVKVEKWRVRLDQDSPRFVSHSISRVPGDSGVVLTVEVVAKDASGLAKLAPFALRAGEKAYPGFLQFNRATKSYRGVVEVPADAAATASLQFVELQDDAGNKQRVSIE